MTFRPVRGDADEDAVADAAADLIDDLREQLRVKELEIEDLQAQLYSAQVIGAAVGVLLARNPGWTEAQAWESWDAACGRFPGDGSAQVLARQVLRTGCLPGD